MIGNWPKYRYKQFKKSQMKRHGIPINYGNVHTKEIKRSLKREKHTREKDDSNMTTITQLIGDFAKQSSFLSLDPEHPLVTTAESDAISLSPNKPDENEPVEVKSKSTFQKMKHKIQKSFHRKPSAELNDGDDEQVATNSDAHSAGSHKSNQSLDQI